MSKSSDLLCAFLPFICSTDFIEEGSGGGFELSELAYIIILDMYLAFTGVPSMLPS